MLFGTHKQGHFGLSILDIFAFQRGRAVSSDTTSISRCRAANIWEDNGEGKSWRAKTTAGADCSLPGTQPERPDLGWKEPPSRPFVILPSQECVSCFRCTEISYLPGSNVNITAIDL